mmetsp:Transcript_43463/g.69540  ORF Transcript_43463/g.69540 Transcript_43463/m.69540 type:complete len:271 (-) Transcript_43463:4528-5340(-)
MVVIQNLHCLMEFQLALVCRQFTLFKCFSLGVNFLLHTVNFEPKLTDHQVERCVALLILLQFKIHLLNLVSHIRNFVFTRLDLALKFFDFVVEYKLELFKLLVFLLQIVDSLLLVLNSLFALLDLFLVTMNVLFKPFNSFVQVHFSFSKLFDSILLFLDIILKRRKFLFHNPILPLESQGCLPLNSKFGYIFLFEFLNFNIGIFLDFLLAIFELIHQYLLLFFNLISFLQFTSKFVLKLLSNLIYILFMTFDKYVILFVPSQGKLFSLLY